MAVGLSVPTTARGVGGIGRRSRLAAAAVTLPAGRRDWGAAMEAELAQVPVQERAARWRFAAGCARAAVFPPGGSRVAVGVAGVAVAATAAAALATGAVLPAGQVFVPTFVGVVGGAGDPGGGSVAPGRLGLAGRDDLASTT